VAFQAICIIQQWVSNCHLFALVVFHIQWLCVFAELSVKLRNLDNLFSELEQQLDPLSVPIQILRICAAASRSALPKVYYHLGSIER
jgi:hypothetical protein